ncbi:hypothetical protein CLTEP_09570 [Clostridium tepidiprofundi DSM 19306]|uniref:Capsule polysaccharide biosynthesis protein n=1 Tax=Clostridium tepidiprofundi DSM 19306 TaxID=1121338 RepID=A0A151B662_9CLOT|nr:capsule biosynthesis protein [Clostridium tepidiprofundi]KYH35137.1 hypothetical protein CLTEP_09570 [Clostridium tepidiprofundi DSM 19306]
MVQTTDIVIDIEKQFDLFDFKIRGFNVWWMSRLKTFEVLEFSRKVFNNDSYKKSSKLVSKLSYFKFIKNINIIPQKFNKTDILCISNTNLRRDCVDGKYFDIIFDYIGKYDDKHSYAVLNTLSGRGFIKNYYSNQCYNMSNIALYINLCRKMYKFILKKEEVKLIVNKFMPVQRYIYDKYSLNINLVEIVLQNTAVIIKGYKKALKIIKSIQPSVIYVECAYSPTHLLFVYAAKTLGINVVEFQHGMISEEHLGYRYNKKIDINDPVPDYLCVFGSHFKRIISGMNIENELKIIEYGYPYLFEKIIDNKNMQKKNNKYDFVITTQGELYANYWCEFVKKLLEYDENINILVKIHPNEVMNYKELYGQILNLDRVEFSIFESVYECLSISKIHLSCYSTCHYEALIYDVPTFVVKFPGWWYIDCLIEYKVPFVSNVGELFNRLKCKNDIMFKEFKKDFFNLKNEDLNIEVLKNRIKETNDFFVKE